MSTTTIKITKQELLLSESFDIKTIISERCKIPRERITIMTLLENIIDNHYIVTYKEEQGTL